MSDDPYTYPGTTILRNKLGIRDAEQLEQLSIAAGHRLELRHIDPNAWIDASKSAHHADYAPLGAAIRAALQRSAN